MTEEGSLIQISHLEWLKWRETEHSKRMVEFINSMIGKTEGHEDGRAMVALREAYIQGWQDGFTKKFTGE